MSTLQLIIHEALHRKLGSTLLLLALVVTVALPTAFFTAGEASKRETIRLMRDLGYNLRIIPKGTDMESFWKLGYAQRVDTRRGPQTRRRWSRSSWGGMTDTTIS